MMRTIGLCLSCLAATMPVVAIIVFVDSIGKEPYGIGLYTGVAAGSVVLAGVFALIRSKQTSTAVSAAIAGFLGSLVILLALIVRLVVVSE